MSIQPYTTNIEQETYQKATIKQEVVKTGESDGSFNSGDQFCIESDGSFNSGDQIIQT